jgi:adenine specific DNA methylase Mod
MAVSKDNHEGEQSIIESAYSYRAADRKNEYCIDPLIRSGTTGEAALNLNRRFIGIEIDKVHYTRTKQRSSKLILATFLSIQKHTRTIEKGGEYRKVDSYPISHQI